MAIGENKDEKIIYIAETEEIASVVNRMFEAKEKKVVFVFPDKSRILHNFINLKLLKREAESLGKDIFIFESDPYVKEMAEMAKVAIYGAKQLGNGGQNLSLRRIVKVADIIKPRKIPAEKELFPKEIFKKVEILPGKTAELESESEYFTEQQFGEEEYFEENRVSEGRSPSKLDEKEISGEAKKEESGNEIVFDDYFLEESAEDDKIERAQKFFETFKEPVAITNPKKKRFSFTSALVVFSGLALIVFLAVLYVVSSKISIEIIPQKDIVDFDIEIMGKSGIGGINPSIPEMPVQYVKTEKNDVREFSATGRKTVDEKARGSIIIYNIYSSSPQSLVATTRFVAEDGKIFRLIKTTTVPGAKIEDGQIIPSSIVADVMADQAGEDYNIGPADFKIPGFEGSPKYESFYGKSDSAMTGGAKGEKTVVSREDIDNAKKELSVSLIKIAESEVMANIPDGYKLLNEAKLVTTTEFDPSLREGDVGDKFSAVIKIKIEAMIFKSEDINTIIERSISERAKKEINWSKAVLNYKTIKPNFIEKTLNLLVSGNIETVEKVNVEELKKSIAGKSVKELGPILIKNIAIEESKIVLRPSWLKTVPSSENKIEITIIK